MVWTSHLDGVYLGQEDAPGEPTSAANAIPYIPEESPAGTPIVAQDSPLARLGTKEILMVVAIAAVTYYVLKKLKK